MLPITRPPIIQEIITHRRTIDHGMLGHNRGKLCII